MSVTYTTVEICRIAGATFRQVDYWCRIGVLRPTYLEKGNPRHATAEPSSGTIRQFTEYEALKAAAIVRMLGDGLSFQTASRLARDGQWAEVIIRPPSGSDGRRGSRKQSVMSIRDWSPGRVSLLDHAQEVHIHTSGSHDQRTGDQYAADLAADTDQSLRHSRRWQNSEPLADHREQCDCPPTAAGCTERRMQRSVADLGSRSGIPAHGGRWATKGAAHDPIALPTPDSNGEPRPVPIPDPDQPEVPR